MNTYYFVDEDKVRQGPIPVDQLSIYDIKPTTLVWRKGMEKWQPAQDVEDLAFLFINVQKSCNTDEGPILKVSNGSNSSSPSYNVNVVLRSAGAAKLQVIKAVKEACGLCLNEAKELVDGAPSILEEGMQKHDAEILKKTLEEAGAEIELRSSNNSMNESAEDFTTLQDIRKEYDSNKGFII